MARNTLNPLARKPRLDQPLRIEDAAWIGGCKQQILAIAIQDGWAYYQDFGTWQGLDATMCRAYEVRPGVLATTSRWVREFASRRARTRMATASARPYSQMLAQQLVLDQEEYLTSREAAAAMGVAQHRVKILCGLMRQHHLRYGDYGLPTALRSETRRGNLAIKRAWVCDRLRHLAYRQAEGIMKARARPVMAIPDGPLLVRKDPVDERHRVAQPHHWQRYGITREHPAQPL